MKVKHFVAAFIVPNTLIRLWYETDGNHEEVISGDKPMMEHQLDKSAYANRNVIGITDILYHKSNYAEAVNLVIERGPELKAVADDMVLKSNTDALSGSPEPNSDGPIGIEGSVKPPIGLIPKWISDRKRLDEVIGAIVRSHDAKSEIYIEWIVEYNQLIKSSK